MMNGSMNFPVWMAYCSNTLYFIMFEICAFLWLCYTENELGFDIMKLKKIVIFLLIFPIIVMSILSATTNLTHLVFYFDELHVYHRGPLAVLQGVLTYFYIGIPSLQALYFGVRATDHDEKIRDFTLATFIVPPVISGVFQVFIPQTPALTVGIAISLTLIYINHENECPYCKAR